MGVGYAAYAPTPINQFQRLIYESGSRITGSYSLGSGWNNLHVNPATGRTEDYDGRNCTAASGAILRDAHTGGRSKANPPYIRNAQDDWSGGIGWDDVNLAWWRLYGERLTIPSGANWTDVMAALREGRAVGVQYDYDQVPYEYQCQKGGTFDHAGVLAATRSDGAVLYYDPLCRHASWVPQYVVRRGAEKLAVAQRGTTGSLFVTWTRVVPAPVSTGWQWHLAPGTRYWSFHVGTTGRIIDREARVTQGASGTCEAPSRHYWPANGKYYPLVKVTSGFLKGRYIDRKYAEVV